MREISPSVFLPCSLHSGRMLYFLTPAYEGSISIHGQRTVVYEYSHGTWLRRPHRKGLNVMSWSVKKLSSTAPVNVVSSGMVRHMTWVKLFMMSVDGARCDCVPAVVKATIEMTVSFVRQYHWLVPIHIESTHHRVVRYGGYDCVGGLEGRHYSRVVTTCSIGSVDSTKPRFIQW